jgi:two-component system sensor histidine kinase/response regulator
MDPESIQAKLDPYRTVFKNTDEVLYLVRISGDPLQGTVELVTQGAARLLGRAPEEFLKDEGLWNRLIHPDDVAGVVKGAEEMCARRQADTWVYRLRHHPSGEYRWMEDHVVPISDDNGKLLGICGVIRDITVQKQIEARLHHQTAELESLLDNMPDGLVVADDSGRILRANAALEKMLGYSRSELESLTIEDLVPVRYRKDHAEQRAEYSAHPRTRRMEGPLNLRARRKDGGEVPVGIMLSYVRAAEGNRVMAIIRDVTMLRLAQQSLTESEERYRRIVETAEEGVWVIDASGCTTYVNGKMASMLGYSVAEMLGRPVFDFVADEDRASVGEKLER